MAHAAMTPKFVISLIVVILSVASATSTPAGETAKNFEVIGHNPLFKRGMNSAPAIFKDYLYVGSRTDGSGATTRYPHAGVLVVDIAKPDRPTVVGEIGPPHEGIVGQTSRELQVWPEQRLLMVMSFPCSPVIHACAVGAGGWSIKFYDLTGPNARSPQLISTYVPSRLPHEMFLWVDPSRRERALLYLSTPTSSLISPNLIVADISRAREGLFAEVVRWTANDLFSPEDRAFDLRLHSMAASPDGTRLYLAYLGGGFLILDTSDLSNNLPSPVIRLASPIATSPRWGNPGAHSAVKILGRPYALVTDEVYGTLIPGHGCPWGWVRLIDITDETAPVVVGEYKIAENEPAYCQSPEGQDPDNTTRTSYSSHNPTVLRNLAFVTWHSGGLRAISLADPASPTTVGVFSPRPLWWVATEDPALSEGVNKVVMWSYPIIKEGLIYVVDIRNGLYVLRYTGPQAREVKRIGFLTGNSNIGDALRLESPAPDTCATD